MSNFHGYSSSSKASQSGPSAGSSSTHWGFSNLSHIKKALCSLFNVTPIQEGKSLQLLTPAECTVAYVTELCRDDNFLQRNTIEENFFANLRESWGKPYTM